LKLFSNNQPPIEKPSRKLVVQQNGWSEFKTINAALQSAVGQELKDNLVIEVAPGEYHEHVSLRNGITLISQVPGAAIIYAPGQGENAGVAVSASGVESATLAGFKITGDQSHPLSVGLRLTDSSVDVSDVEIANAEMAGVEISGADNSTLRSSYIHSYRDAGVNIGGASSSLITRNVITRAESQEPSGRPAIRIDSGARPRFEWNTIYETEDVLGLEGEARIQFRKNNFVVPAGRPIQPEPQASPQQPGQPRPRWLTRQQ
jgi:hypothetical protein